MEWKTSLSFLCIHMIFALLLLVHSINYLPRLSILSLVTDRVIALHRNTISIFDLDFLKKCKQSKVSLGYNTSSF